MYIAPRMTTYRREDLQELMGPVETQYCEVTDVDAMPDSFLVGKMDITLVLNFDPCEAFETANVTLIDSMNVRIPYQFNRADGTISGTIWTLPSFEFGFPIQSGDYMIEVVLIDANGSSSEPQFTSFTVL